MVTVTGEETVIIIVMVIVMVMEIQAAAAAVTVLLMRKQSKRDMQVTCTMATAILMEVMNLGVWRLGKTA